MIKRLLKLVVIGVIGLLILVVYWYSPYKIEGYGYYDKIWAHRANSIAKAQSALGAFKGIELDLVYDKASNAFDVNHPPAISINLSLETYLSNIPLSKEPYLWLDIKNLNANNAYLILKRLEVIFENYKHSKVLVETVNPAALPIFDRSGFITSYYLPYGLCLKDSKDLEETIALIKRNLLLQPNLALSSDYQDYSIVSKYFPKRNKYFWAIERPINSKYKAIRTVLKDTTVKALLLNYKTFNSGR